MKQYVFILGHSPALSAAELFSVFPEKKAVFTSTEAVILELDEIKAIETMKRLGGTVKLGEILIKTTEKDLAEGILKILKTLTPAEGKLVFGLSQYGLSQPKLGAIIKKQLKEQGVKSRWAISRNPVLSSADVVLNKLLGKGVELLIIKNREDIFIAKTLAVQEFEEYSQRDYGRPARDVKSGMLPPKVAKMMINLAQAPFGGRIIDPFCGSGTILQEALLLGYQDVWGSDISKKAMQDSRTNLKWLREKLNLADKYDYGLRIKQIDAEKLSDYFEENYFDAIITEPYLGPPLRGRETENEIKDIIKELSELYLKFFIQAKFVLKPGGRIVIIFPVFILNNKKLFLPILDKIEKIGFKMKLPVPVYNSLGCVISPPPARGAESRTEDPVPLQGKFGSSGAWIKSPLPHLPHRQTGRQAGLPEDWGFAISERNSIIYSRAGQRVQREIFIFES